MLARVAQVVFSGNVTIRLAHFVDVEVTDVDTQTVLAFFVI
jgi:hypothetical protein